jgi:hypothetical protein
LGTLLGQQVVWIRPQAGLGAPTTDSRDAQQFPPMTVVVVDSFSHAVDFGLCPLATQVRPTKCAFYISLSAPNLFGGERSEAPGLSHRLPAAKWTSPSRLRDPAKIGDLNTWDSLNSGEFSYQHTACSQLSAGWYNSSLIVWTSGKDDSDRERVMAQLTPQEEFERSRKILTGNPGWKDRKPGYRVKHRDDGRTGVIVAVGGDRLAVLQDYTVRWDDGETQDHVEPQLLDDAFD